MVLTPHILAGAALGASISNPVMAVVGAFALHFALDAIPHWDYDIYSSRKKAALKVGADLVIASIIILLLIWHMPIEQQIHTLIGGFFGVLPDGFLFLSFIFKNKYLDRFARFHNFWHWLIVPKGTKSPFIWGFGVQIAVILLAILNIF